MRAGVGTQSQPRRGEIGIHKAGRRWCAWRCVAPPSPGAGSRPPSVSPEPCDVGLSLTSMMATQLLVVPRSMPIISLNARAVVLNARGTAACTIPAIAAEGNALNHLLTELEFRNTRGEPSDE